MVAVLWLEWCVGGGVWAVWCQKHKIRWLAAQGAADCVRVLGFSMDFADSCAFRVPTGVART